MFFVLGSLLAAASSVAGTRVAIVHNTTLEQGCFPGIVVRAPELILPLWTSVEYHAGALRWSGYSSSLLAMQNFRSALVPLLSICCALAAGAAPKVHVVTVGAARKVPYIPPEATAETLAGQAATLRVRPLLVDGLQREWTVGDLHDVTDRSFTIRRALRLNDALPGESPRWTWQPGPWLLIDRVSGHVVALHLPAFDPAVSEVVWYRDYAAYCGITTTVKGGLVAVVAQLSSRKTVALKIISKWPVASPPHPACGLARWQRAPMRATLQPTGAEAITFDVVGTSSFIEDGDEE
jgi:hypothetical protein